MAEANKVQSHFIIEKDDLPLHCPTSEQSLWDAHPRVYLPIEKTGEAKCPYCGAEYILKDHKA